MLGLIQHASSYSNQVMLSAVSPLHFSIILDVLTYVHYRPLLLVINNYTNCYTNEHVCACMYIVFIT